MLYISRSRSLSVKTTPFTFATGFPLTCIAAVMLTFLALGAALGPVALETGLAAGSDGAWEATCAPAVAIPMMSRSVAQIWYFIFLSISWLKPGEGIPSPVE